jgi:hypothetical protein
MEISDPFSMLVDKDGSDLSYMVEETPYNFND